MLRQITDRTRHGLVLFSDILSGNGAGLFLPHQNPHKASTTTITANITSTTTATSITIALNLCLCTLVLLLLVLILPVLLVPSDRSLRRITVHGLRS